MTQVGLKDSWHQKKQPILNFLLYSIWGAFTILCQTLATIWADARWLVLSLNKVTKPFSGIGVASMSERKVCWTM